MKRYVSYFPFALVLITILTFFNPMFLSGKVPLPADTIIGLYHPFRDLYATEYPRGIPYKNFLITDPVRQQYPWRYLAIAMVKRFELPLWNPYTFAGMPLMANFQSAVFYPLNIVYVFFPFLQGWSVQVMLQSFLSGLFLYLYLRKLKLISWGSALGGIVFAFSGFSIGWLEWNTVIHTALWLPLVLLAKEHLIERMSVRWIVVLIFAECAQFFAGHLQVWFYSFLISNAYLWVRLFQQRVQTNKNAYQRIVTFSKVYRPFILIGAVVGAITAVQWIPTMQFVGLSARSVDLSWEKEGWFLPFSHLIQFLAPDFFGNPSTLNYWGQWNYGEFVGYIGILPLLLCFYALLFRRDKKTYAFGLLSLFSLLFALPTFLAKVPFLLGIPFLSTAQPTRLLFVTTFSFAILAGLGLDYAFKSKRKMYIPAILLAVLFGLLWCFVLGFIPGAATEEQLLVARRNLLLPTVLFVGSTVLLFLLTRVRAKLSLFILIAMLVFTSFDLMRFATKFTPFTDSVYVYPSTAAIAFLQKNIGNYRVMSTDSRLLPPNFSLMYKLQTVDGYDPLYLRRYGELIAASERGEPNIAPPFGFNRIITPRRYESQIIDMLGVKYVLSFSDIRLPKFKKVFQEGTTIVYENTTVLPRTFFVNETVEGIDSEDTIRKMFVVDSLRTTAIVDVATFQQKQWATGSAQIVEYTENNIVINTELEGNEDGFLVLTDNYFPTWRVTIIDEAEKEQNAVIVRTNHTLRGVVVPSGKNTVVFYNNIF